MELLKGLAGGFLFLAVMGICLVVLGFYVLAAAAGVEELLGWSGWWVGAILFLMISMRVGFFIISCLGAYGAYAAWGWDWYLVAGVFFPFLIIAIAATLGGGILAIAGGFYQKMFGGRRAGA